MATRRVTKSPGQTISFTTMLLTLPAEVLNMIFAHLTQNDLLAVATSCSSLKNLTNNYLHNAMTRVFSRGESMLRFRSYEPQRARTISYNHYRIHTENNLYSQYIIEVHASILIHWIHRTTLSFHFQDHDYEYSLRGPIMTVRNQNTGDWVRADLELTGEMWQHSPLMKRTCPILLIFEPGRTCVLQEIRICSDALVKYLYIPLLVRNLIIGKGLSLSLKGEGAMLWQKYGVDKS